jgi:uncharacterized membrane protein (DUF106 family)
MLKAIVIIVLVVGVIVGGLLVLRNSTTVGMPSDEVMNRAKKRARELAAAEKDDPDQAP